MDVVVPHWQVPLPCHPSAGWQGDLPEKVGDISDLLQPTRSDIIRSESLGWHSGIWTKTVIETKFTSVFVYTPEHFPANPNYDVSFGAHGQWPRHIAVYQMVLPAASGKYPHLLPVSKRLGNSKLRAVACRISQSWPSQISGVTQYKQASCVPVSWHINVVLQEAQTLRYIVLYCIIYFVSSIKTLFVWSTMKINWYINGIQSFWGCKREKPKQ